MTEREPLKERIRTSTPYEYNRLRRFDRVLERITELEGRFAVSDPPTARLRYRWKDPVETKVTHELIVDQQAITALKRVSVTLFEDLKGEGMEDVAKGLAQEYRRKRG